MYVAYLFFEIT